MSTTTLTTLSPLTAPHGSARLTLHDHTLLSTVYGPIEAGRRDEQPESCIVEVSLRPLHGPGGVRERHLESIIKSTLKAIILLNEHPRCLVSVSLQVLGVPTDHEESRETQGGSYLGVLPAALMAAQMALLDAGVAMGTVFGCVLLRVGETGEVSVGSGGEKGRNSRHVVAYTAGRQMLLAESEGSCSLAEMRKVWRVGKEACLNEEDGLLVELRRTVKKNVEEGNTWTRAGD